MGTQCLVHYSLQLDETGWYHYNVLIKSKKICWYQFKYIRFRISCSRARVLEFSWKINPDCSAPNKRKGDKSTI